MYSGYQFLSDVWQANIFSSDSVAFLFTPVMVSLHHTDFGFTMFHFQLLVLMPVLQCPGQNVLSCFYKLNHIPYFFSIRFSTSRIILSSLIHLKLSFVKVKPNLISSLNKIFCWKCFLFSGVYFDLFVKNHMAIGTSAWM